MTALKFGLGFAACMALPILIAGALAGLAYDQLQRRRDWQTQWDELVDEAQSWLASATIGDPE